MSQLVDTHCHIQSAGAESGEATTRRLWGKAAGVTADQLVQNAQSAGVNKLICVGCDVDDSRLAVDLAARSANCWASVGIHPHEAKHYANEDAKLAELAELAAKPRVVAIGECGFDYHYNHSGREDQAKVFDFQIGLAQKRQLPIIFHVRDAFDDFWPKFNNYSGLTGILHSFTDTMANMQLAVDKGLYIGVNGIATFTKDQNQLEVYRAIPLERLVVETDAPFLTPTPYRGNINQPKYVEAVVEFLANLRGDSREVIAAATTQNARNLFGI